MLIDSGRFINGDIEVWENNVATDEAYTKLKTLQCHENDALNALCKFTKEDTSGYVGVSWGKDSVCMAHIHWRSKVKMPLVWIRIDPLFNPDCLLVRDAFLKKYDVDYHEIVVPWSDDQREIWATQMHNRSAGYSPKVSAAMKGFKLAKMKFGDRHVSGVRGQESGMRKLRMRRWGHSTKKTSAPIGYWLHQDVFSYLHKYDLPIHPAYAMTRGGLIDRFELRVDALGGGRGCEYGYPRDVWEGLYYPDSIFKITTQARKENKTYGRVV